MTKLKTCNYPQSLKSLLLLSGLFYSTASLALVDYTETRSFTPKNSGAKRARKAPSTQSSSTTSLSSRSQSSGRARSGFFSAALNYQNNDVKVGQYSGNVSSVGISTHFETPYNIFLDASYSQGKLSDDLGNISTSENTGLQSGNPEVMLGFNWLEFGAAQEAAHIDLLAGARIGQSDSDFATQRTDKMFGVTTAKRFYNFALGLGYQMTITGDSDETELSIGNISKLSASLGWVVSPDIRFMVEANSYSIGRSTENTTYKLEEKTKVSVISPKLILGISPLVDLSLGAHFSSRRLQNDKLLGAKLWNLDGLYGNSLYVKMGINL